MKLNTTVENAYKTALNARKNSHSPYSRFQVGAALQVSGQAAAIGGCNVENASFGATVCAERSALFSAVSQLGKLHTEFMVVVTGEEKATVPCALCLQVLAEFCADDFVIYLGNETAIQRQLTLRELLPQPFRSFKPSTVKI